MAKQTEKLSLYTKGGFDTLVQATQMVEEKIRDADRQLGSPLPMPLPINAPTIWGILGLVGEEIKSVAKRFSPKAEVEAALARVKKMEDADLVSDKDLKASDTKSLMMMNAALNKIKEQEERILKLEGTLDDIKMTRKLDSQNLGFGGNGDLNLGASRTAITPG